MNSFIQIYKDYATAYTSRNTAFNQPGYSYSYSIIMCTRNVRTHFNLATIRDLQYRHLIPAPVDRTFASDWLYYHAWITCQKNKPSTATTQVHCSLRIKTTFSCEIIHASMPRKLGCNRACGRELCPGCPRI